MATLYTHQAANIRKTWFIMIGFFIFIMFVGWGFSYIYDDPSILAIAVVFSLVMNVASYWYSDKIVISLSGAKPVTRESHREYWNIVENLSIASGLPMPKLYVIEDQAPNAFATGRNPQNAAIAATTGLLQIMDRSELEGVLAHELSHIGNRDILVSTVVVVLVGFVTLLSDFFLRMTFYGGGRRDNKGDGRLQLILILVGVALAILSPLIATLIKLAISRKREFLADVSGALMTRYPEGLASALQKISAYGQPLKRANHATAHLYIANPFSDTGHKTGFLTKLFMTHPPMQERVEALLGKIQ